MIAMTQEQKASKAGQVKIRGEVQILKDALDLARTLDLDDRPAFGVLIHYMLLMGYTQANLADEFHTSEASVSRWASGKSLPVKLARKAIAERIAAMLSERLTEQQQDLLEVCA